MLKSRMQIVDAPVKTPPKPTKPADKPEPESGEEDEHAAEEVTAEEATAEEHGYQQGIILSEFPERRLNRSEVSVRLSLLGRTAEGDGYTYLKATITNLGLTEISAIRSFKHLQFLDVSNNHIKSSELQAISGLPSLVLIQADQNLLLSAYLPKLKYLQVIIMNSNYLTTVSDVYQPELSTLEVGNNKIDKIQFDNKMPSIRCLDFRNNLVQEITNLNFPILDSLYLAGNRIKSLVGVDNLVNLRILHVRGNPIKLLTGFSEANKKLEYLNLRSCKVGTYMQVKKLKVLTGLQTLIMKGCPYMGGTGEDDTAGGGEEDDAGIRVEMLVALPWLKRINKGHITPEERVEAKELMKQWLEEGKEDEEELPEEMVGEEATNDED